MLGSLSDTRGQFINLLTQDLCICHPGFTHLPVKSHYKNVWIPGKVLWKHLSIDPQVFISLAGRNCWPMVFFGTSNKQSLSKHGILSLHTTTLESTWSLCISSCRYFGAVLSALVMSFDAHSILTTTADYKWSAIWLCIYFYMCMFYVFLFIWFVILL